MTIEPTADDRRHELAEILMTAEECVKAGPYDADKPMGKAGRDQLRASCLEWGPAACRRALYAEARVKELEAKATKELHEYEELASRAYFTEQKLGFLQAAIDGPPAGTRVEHDAQGNVIRIVFPGQPVDTPGAAG